MKDMQYIWILINDLNYFICNFESFEEYSPYDVFENYYEFRL